MNTFLFKKKFSHTSNHHQISCTKQQPLTIAGILSLSILSLPYNVLAADFGSQLNSSISLNDGDTIVADQIYSTHLYGLASPTNSSANFELANNVNNTAIGNGTRTTGIYISGTDSIVNANQIKIYAEGTSGIIDFVSGISAISASYGEHHFNLGNDSEITAKAAYASYGINVGATGKLQANRLTIESQSNQSAYGITSANYNNYTQYVDLGSDSKITAIGNALSYGISLSDNSTIIANGLTMNVQSNATTIGIRTHGNHSKTDLGENSIIRVSGGSSAIGIFLSGEFTANALTIDVTGTYDALGLSAYSGNAVDANIGANSHISVVNGTGINFTPEPAAGQTAILNFRGSETQRNTITVSGNEMLAGAGATFERTELNLDNTDIYTNYLGSEPISTMGLLANMGGIVNANNVTINSTSSSTIGAFVLMDGVMNITGDSSIIQADARDIAIMNGKDNSPSILGNTPLPGGTLNASGKLNIYGSVFSHDGLTDLQLQSGSVWTGLGQNNVTGNGVLNVSMTDSQWNMIDNSSIDALALNNGRVIFADNGANSVLTVGDLSGNGEFVLNTNLVGDGDGINNFGDKLVVTGSSAGTHQLTVLNQGSLATTGNEVLTVVETQDGQARFTGTSQVELGGYLYDIRQNGNNWEVYSVGEDVEPPVTENPEPQPDDSNSNNNGNNNSNGNNGGGSIITTTADAGANFLNIGYLMNYAETQTLLRRMGDLRQNNEHGNMWLRGFAGKFSSFSGGKLSRFDMNYSGFQLGADKRLSTDIPLFTGLFIGQTNGSPDYRTGDGSARSSHMGIYGSYMANNGFYVDTVVKYANIKNSFNVRDSQNNQVSGQGKSQSISASLESGQKFSFSADNNGFYIEPQLQFSYGHQDSTRIKASNGLRVDLGSYESMLGRASTLLGYEINQGDNNVNLYLKTGVIREFDGDVSYRLNGSQEKHSFKGNGWNNGVGVSAQLGKQHTFYLDVDTVRGNKFDQRQINGGYRFSF